jgi:hypothetical protein
VDARASDIPYGDVYVNFRLPDAGRWREVADADGVWPQAEVFGYLSAQEARQLANRLWAAADDFERRAKREDEG